VWTGFIRWCSFRLNRYVDWLVQANVSGKRAVSIFRAEVMSLDCEGPHTKYRVVGGEGEGKGGRGRRERKQSASIFPICPVPSDFPPYRPVYVVTLSSGSSHHLWRWRQQASPKSWLIPTNPHANLTQNIIITFFTATKILNLTWIHLINNRDRWRAFVNTVMNTRYP
jgi:hypothetical protein